MTSTRDFTTAKSDDQAELDAFGTVLTPLWERPGDDGMFWRRQMIFAGVEVVAVGQHLFKLHVQLPSGSWLVVEPVEARRYESAMLPFEELLVTAFRERIFVEDDWHRNSPDAAERRRNEQDRQHLDKIGQWSRILQRV